MNPLKSLALYGISRGLRLPEARIDRISELGHLRELIAQLGIDCVVDVGANRGQFSTELRGIGYKGHIISFEPIPSEFAAMAEHFRGDAHWTGFQVALGSRSATMTVTIPKLTVMSSLLESTTPEDDARHEEVEVKRLDGLLPELLRARRCSRVFMKMDTQGFDLEVFRGASDCLPQIHGLQSELSVQPLYRGMPHYIEALDVYEKAGFELFNLSVVNRIDTGGLLELNCFMRRAIPSA